MGFKPVSYVPVYRLMRTIIRTDVRMPHALADDLKHNLMDDH